MIMGVYRESLNEVCGAVESIKKQSFDDWELIICTDGVKDAEVIKLLDEYAESDSRIHVIKQKENHGLGSALNRCLERASGKYIARMDADDISAPYRLEWQIRELKNHPEAQFCGCAAVLFDSRGSWSVSHRPSLPGKRDFLRYSPYIHPTVVFRSSVFKEGNEKYSEDKMMRRCEDYELFLRLWLKGCFGRNMQDELYRYRVDRNAYHKRGLNDRVNEMRMRWVCFGKMSVAVPVRIICSLRPLLGVFAPTYLLKKLKPMDP